MSSSGGTNWMQLVAATAVGAAVSYVVTREIDRRYPKDRRGELEENPRSRGLSSEQEKILALLEED